MKKFITYLVLVISHFVLQSSFLPHFELAGTTPNIMIILTVSIAIIKGSRDGCLVGFACGLLTDIFFGTHLGLYALGFLLVGYITGIFNRIFYKEDITFPILIIGGADLSYELFIYITGFMIRGRLNLFYYLRRIILPEIVYTVIAAIFLYRFLLFLCEHLLKERSENTIV